MYVYIYIKYHIYIYIYARSAVAFVERGEEASVIAAVSLPGAAPSDCDP